MTYEINEIKSTDEMDRCISATLDNFQWGSVQAPKTFGKIGHTKDGLTVEMTCYEEKPKAEFYNHLDPVYEDSAMETFFALVPKGQELPRRDDFYINIEFNSNGAVNAAYGFGRKNRTKFSTAQIDKLNLQIEKEEKYWRATFMLPFYLIKELYKDDFDLWINFYKISQSPEIEHYGSFSKINSDTPDFHRPDCFAKAEIKPA